MRISILLTVLSVFFCCQTYAQYYGGSAHVSVKDDEGNSRIIIATWPCVKNDESDAKSQLKSSLDGKKHSDEVFSSGISYDIVKCLDNDDKYYGGTAWVKVEDDDGKSRVINTDWPCVKDDVADAKGQLFKSLDGKRHSDEHFISKAHFDIDSCD